MSFIIDGYTVNEWTVVEMTANKNMINSKGEIVSLASINIAISSYLGPVRKFLIVYRYPPLFEFYSGEYPLKFDTIDAAQEIADLNIKKWHKFKAFI